MRQRKSRSWIGQTSIHFQKSRIQRHLCHHGLHCHEIKAVWHCRNCSGGHCLWNLHVLRRFAVSVCCPSSSDWHHARKCKERREKISRLYLVWVFLILVGIHRSLSWWCSELKLGQKCRSDFRAVANQKLRSGQMILIPHSNPYVRSLQIHNTITVSELA